MARPASDPHERYRQAHWGIPSNREYEVHDPDLPQRGLVEMGKLRGLEVREGLNKRGRKFQVDFPPVDGDHDPMLVFSSNRDEKLYIIVQHDPALLARCRALFVHADVPFYDLNETQTIVRGRQARYPLPSIPVQIVGRLAAVIYATEKKGDRPSSYRHKMGEEGGDEPLLCVSADGRLWISGGTYTVPNAGITR